MLETIKTYLLVTKPGIIFGNLITAAAGFMLASKGRVDTALLLSMTMGLSLVIASGCVFNNCIDRNMDKEMARTKHRALAQGLISPGAALLYGTLLGIAGMTLLFSTTKPLCGIIVLAGFIVYVVLYSLYLKPRSVQSTLIGSLAGAAPPLAGYCAVSNRFDMGALILLLIFGLWQMPHCYAIAVFRYKDYAAANIPILPIKKGIPSTRKHVIGYMLAFIAATLMLTFGGYTGYGFLAVAISVNLFWLHTAWRGFGRTDNRIWARKLFMGSILTVTILCAMMSIDFTAKVTPDMLLASRFDSRQFHGEYFNEPKYVSEANERHPEGTLSRRRPK
jgi:heme o synthase